MDYTPPPEVSAVVTGSAAASTSTGTTPPPPPLPPPNNKILSRNANGTLIYTQRPRDEAELQLYRVMQRASLLVYYDTLLEMGGDDVQQLCEAGEEEFLEIMALVGMASKPLHVRRLQKALQEWLSNPAMFQTPLGATGSATCPRGDPLSPPGHSHSPIPPLTSQSPTPIQQQTADGRSSATSPGPGAAAGVRGSSPPGSPLQLTPVLVPAQIARLADAAQRLVRSLPHLEPKATAAKKKTCKDLEHLLGMPEDDPRRMDQIRKFSAIYGRFDCKRKPEKPLTLHEVSVNEAAAQLCRLAPALLTRRDELFPLARQVVRDSGYHYSKGHSKSYASIGAGRLSIGHNGDSVGPTNNKRARLEASSSSPSSVLAGCDTQEDVILRLKRQERLTQVGEELCRVAEQIEEILSGYRNESQDFPPLHVQVEALQARRAQLLLEQNELMKHNHINSSTHRLYTSGTGNGAGGGSRVTGQESGSINNNNRRPSRISSSSCYDSEKLDTDDTDSQFSLSNASSPSQEVGDSRDSLRESDGADPTRSPPKSTIKQDILVQDHRITADNDNDINMNEGGTKVAGDCKQITTTKIEPIDNHYRDGNDDDYEDSYFHENKVQVIASSGGNIIAVANPALSMSPAITNPQVLLKKELPLVSTSTDTN
ncbi:NGFI-A-binding protein homolog [Lycorma delicatula]|uniref:NGFI-A-binding protein homolog n=1 Tax=Lycorma delicatula TaxID=130591 RepID=UPI003F516EDB